MRKFEISYNNYDTKNYKFLGVEIEQIIAPNQDTAEKIFLKNAIVNKIVAVIRRTEHIPE